jgi:hypothetical protein
MSFSDLAQWTSAGIAGLCLVVSLFTFFSTRNRSEMDDLWKITNDHGVRIGKIESALEHMPTKEDVHGIEIKLTEQNGRLQAIESHLDALTKDFQRLFQAILESKKP